MQKIIHDIFDNKTILILGFGREGKESLALINNYISANYITIADKNVQSIPTEIQEKYQCVTGVDYAKDILKYDIIVKSPGIPESIVKDVDKEKITSQTDIFLRKYHSQTIGITGTKGKSTTSSLLTHILANSGIHSILVGNIGIPPFSALDIITNETIIVMELSAHQLQHISVAPHISIFLNIHEEHLDHFQTFENYFNAKSNIFLKQNSDDIIIINKNEDEIIEKLQNSDVKSQIMYTDIAKSENIKTNLCGSHNKVNISFAILAASLSGISAKNIEKGITSFKPLPHRLEYVGTFNEIDFYNDSISTIPEAAIAAMDTLPNVGTVILGGFDRGISYKKLAKHIVKYSDLNVILTGEAGIRIGSLIEEASSKHTSKIETSKENNVEDTRQNINIFYAKNMEDIINIAFANTRKGKQCLLSPAASSYDQYSNFEERGECFVETIRMVAERQYQ